MVRRLKTNIVVDGVTMFAVTTELQQSMQEDGIMRWRPNAEFVIPGRSPVVLRGLFISKPGELTEGEVHITNVTQDPIMLKGL